MVVGKRNGRYDKKARRQSGRVDKTRSLDIPRLYVGKQLHPLKEAVFTVGQVHRRAAFHVLVLSGCASSRYARKWKGWRLLEKQLFAKSYPTSQHATVIVLR
ncbi:hypothetical protein CLAIMM_11900 [Cladophialophora immunda]|nr:hypothetical protein CLAIMM_11900 [Cladophialophora immunda]